MTPSMVEEAVGLTEEFADNTDDLSLRSIEWIVETAAAAHRMEPEARDRYLRERVHLLVTTILVDMRFRPLKDPVMDGDGYIWSRRCYESYKSNFGISPMTMRPFSEELLPHLLAARIIALVEPLLPRAQEGALVPPHADEAPPTPDEMLRDYMIIMNSQAAQQDRMLARRFREETSRVGALETDLERRSARSREESEREAAERTAQLRRNIAAATARYREENEPLRTAVRVGEERAFELDAELNARKAESRDLGNANCAVQNEVRQLQNQVQQQYAGSRCGAGDWCTML